MIKLTEEVTKARLFAIAAHTAVGQKRKYTGAPYWHHCQEVAQMVQLYSSGYETVQAAWLHDVVEDTKITIQDLGLFFSSKVVRMVEQLTDVSKPEDGNRAVRKALDREHYANASKEAKTIKLADLISNTRDITKHDPDFAVVYLEEKRLLLPYLKGGNPQLFATAERLANP